MSKLKRYYKKGNVYFVTIVTDKRLPLLLKYGSEISLKIKDIVIEFDTHIPAYVILSDHIHLLIDPKQNNLSDLIKKLKLRIAYLIRKNLNLYRGVIWQSRFWDHVIRDQNDYNRHFDYIHYNPVKHKFVSSPFEWEFTSIHQFKDIYSSDWGIQEIYFDGKYGE